MTTTNKAKHTAGPWVVRFDQSMILAKDPEGVMQPVAQVYNHILTDQWPNAALIAASPTMFLALQSAKTLLEHLQPEGQLAEETALEITAAIAKATGRTE